MKSKIRHCNINVLDIDKSLAFYKEALGLEPVRTKEGNGFKLVFIGDGETDFSIELTWLADRKEPYDLGDNESHIAFTVEAFDAAHAHHEKMGCICFENKDMGIYFIEDPDGYWLEILPPKR